ncbi:MAG: transposase [Bacteroidota bacterium]
MFKKNQKHKQADIFGFSSILPASYVEEIEESTEKSFYDLIFSQIREEDFSCLYSDKFSRPNAPINCIIGSILLQQNHHWTIDGLFENIKFNLLTKVALGLQTIHEMPFNQATFFNTQNRLNDYFVKTGINLLEKLFDHLTDDQLKMLKIKTNIQRTDSFQAASNIRRYSRLQLLVEMLIRIHRVLGDDDRKSFDDIFAPYVNKTSGQFIYRLDQTGIQTELENIGRIYQRIYTELFPRYHDVDIFTIFERVYTEHFTVVEEKITLIDAKTLSTNTLQSPDDIEATYVKKKNTAYRGYAVNIVETCHPENQLNVITDISVSTNNVDDSKILHERLDVLKEKTPDIAELHNDGAYGSNDNDAKCLELGITQIQTAIRGKEAAIETTIQLNELSCQQTDVHCYHVSCPHQTVVATKGRKRFKAAFDNSLCAACPLNKQCNLITDRSNKHRLYYFSEKDFQRKKRAHNIVHIPPERRTLRANIEATVSEFKRKMPDDKVKVRGQFKTMLFAIATGIGINFGRIVRYLDDLVPEETHFASAS